MTVRDESGSKQKHVDDGRSRAGPNLRWEKPGKGDYFTGLSVVFLRDESSGFISVDGE